LQKKGKTDSSNKFFLGTIILWLKTFKKMRQKSFRTLVEIPSQSKVPFPHWASFKIKFFFSTDFSSVSKNQVPQKTGIVSTHYSLRWKYFFIILLSISPTCIWAAFTCKDPKSAKRQSSHQCLSALLGS